MDTLLYQNANTELPYNVTVAEFIELIADLENKVDGVADSQGIVTMSNGQEVANLVRMPCIACVLEASRQCMLAVGSYACLHAQLPRMQPAACLAQWGNHC